MDRHGEALRHAQTNGKVKKIFLFFTDFKNCQLKEKKKNLKWLVEGGKEPLDGQNETIGGDFSLVVESANVVVLRNGNVGQGEGGDAKDMDEEKGQGKQH